MGDQRYYVMRTTMKVLGLFGSPRRGGNTDLLLEEMLRGAIASVWYWSDGIDNIPSK